MLGMVGFYWKIYKTAVAATEAYKRGFIEQKTSGLSSSASENALTTLRIHRGGGGNVLQRHSNGCLSELLPRPSAAVIQGSRRSVATATAAGHAASFRRGAIVTASAVRPDVTSRPIPKIIVTATPSCTEDDIRRQRETRSAGDEQQQGEGGRKTLAGSRKNKNKKSRDRKNSSKQDGGDASPSSAAGSSETPGVAAEADCSTKKKEKRKSSFLGLFDASDGAGGDRRLSLQIAARFAKLHIISQQLRLQAVMCLRELVRPRFRGASRTKRSVLGLGFSNKVFDTITDNKANWRNVYTTSYTR